MEVKHHTSPQEEEVFLKDLILKFQDWCAYILSKWLIILLFGLVGAGLGLSYALIKKPNYVGELTFVLEDNKSNPLSAYMGLASQIGLDIGGGYGSGVFGGDNIIEFLRSRLMIEKTLLSPIIVNGKVKSLADLYIEINELDKKWESNPVVKDLRFPLHLERSKFSLQQDSVLNIFQESITKKNLEIRKLDKKLSFISVTCTSRDERFSKAFVERLVAEATDFYVNTKIKHSKINVDKLQLTADSLESLLNRKTYALAASQDINQNPVKQMASVGAQVQARDKMVLQTMYAEVVKNLEFSKMSMALETPLVQIVDTPILPLEKKKFGKLKGIVIGGFISGFLVVGFLVSRRFYKKVMEK